MAGFFNKRDFYLKIINNSPGKSGKKYLDVGNKFLNRSKK